MDSTFMGILASLAIKVKGIANAGLQLCGVTEKNQDSLEELGLDSLMEINPAQAAWLPDCQEIRARLSRWTSTEQARPDSKLVLDTHKTLGSLNASNQQKFSDVVEGLQNEN